MSQYIEVTVSDPEGAREAPAGRSAALKNVGRAVTAPVFNAIKAEQPQTLAKIALAALAPHIVKSTLRVMARHPLLSVAGLAGASVWAMKSQSPKTSMNPRGA